MANKIVLVYNIFLATKEKIHILNAGREQKKKRLIDMNM